MSDNTISADDLAEMAESDPGAEPGPDPTGAVGELEEPQDVGPGTDPGAEPESGESGSAIWDMLLSTDPDMSPRDARGVFDMSVSPADHLEVGIAKMTDSGGTPAIVHLAMSAVLAVGGGDVIDGDDSDDSPDVSEGFDID